METKNKQNKKKGKTSTWKRAKRIARNVIRELVDYVKSLIDRFKKLPEHIKLITGAWAVVVLLIILIIFASTGNKRYLEEYYSLENILTDSTLSYVKKNKIYPVRDSKLKLDMEELYEFGTLDRKELDNKRCSGFSLTYYDEESGEYVIKSFVNCDKYTTKDYGDYK